MTSANADPFAKFKAAQREAWASFAPVEVISTMPAAKLVKFAEVAAGEKLLDVACGTGAVAVTAARRGAKVCGLDLSPVLLQRARHNASVANLNNDFVEGDAEALPYPNASFDVVLRPVRPYFRSTPCRGADRDAAGAPGRRTHRVLDLAARTLHRTNVRFGRKPSTAGTAGRRAAGAAPALG
jgi:SAM-dependent methyltransferase